MQRTRQLLCQQLVDLPVPLQQRDPIERVTHDDDLDSVVLVGVVCASNASSLGRLSLVKSSFDHDLPAT